MCPAIAGSSRPGRASPKGWRSLPEPQLAGAPGAAGRPGGAPAEKDEYLVVLKFTKNVELMRGVKDVKIDLKFIQCKYVTIHSLIVCVEHVGGYIQEKMIKSFRTRWLDSRLY